MPHTLTISDQARRANGQAIGFLMQQAVENADCLSLAAGLVDEQTLPAELARITLNELLGEPHKGRQRLQYGTTQGPDPLRRVFRTYLAALEQRTDQLEHIPLRRFCLTTGSQQLLTLIVRALFNPGDICLVAAPTYFVFLGVLQAAGATIIPVQSDQNGMQPQALQTELQRLQDQGQLHRVRLVYIVSDFENPTGVSVSAERRPKLLQITKHFSQESRILLLEDAAYRELHFDVPPQPSIWSLDDDQQTVILAQTFSKSFSPGVRVGLGVLPDELIQPVSDLKGNDDFGSPHLNQHLIARTLKNGTYKSHVAKVRESYRGKRNAMLTAIDREFSNLTDVTWYRPNGGMYVWMKLPEHIETGFNSPLFRAATQQHKVMYVPGELCYPPDWPQAPRCEMRLSYGVLSEELLDEGICRLARAVRSQLSQ